MNAVIESLGSILDLFSSVFGLRTLPPTKPNVQDPSEAANKQYTLPEENSSVTETARSSSVPISRMFLALQRTVPFSATVDSQSKSVRESVLSIALR